VTFGGNLSGRDAAQITSSAGTVVTGTLTSGTTAADVQANLQAIPALAGNVAVSGGGPGAGGLYTVTFGGSLTGVAPIAPGGTIATIQSSNAAVSPASATVSQNGTAPTAAAV